MQLIDIVTIDKLVVYVRKTGYTVLIIERNEQNQNYDSQPIEFKYPFKEEVLKIQTNQDSYYLYTNNSVYETKDFENFDRISDKRFFLIQIQNTNYSVNQFGMISNNTSHQFLLSTQIKNPITHAFNDQILISDKQKQLTKLFSITSQQQQQLDGVVVAVSQENIFIKYNNSINIYDNQFNQVNQIYLDEEPIKIQLINTNNNSIYIQYSEETYIYFVNDQIQKIIIHNSAKIQKILYLAHIADFFVMREERDKETGLQNCFFSNEQNLKVKVPILLLGDIKQEIEFNYENYAHLKIINTQDAVFILQQQQQFKQKYTFTNELQNGLDFAFMEHSDEQLSYLYENGQTIYEVQEMKLKQCKFLSNNQLVCVCQFANKDEGIVIAWRENDTVIVKRFHDTIKNQQITILDVDENNNIILFQYFHIKGELHQVNMMDDTQMEQVQIQNSEQVVLISQLEQYRLILYYQESDSDAKIKNKTYFVVEDNAIDVFSDIKIKNFHKILVMEWQENGVLVGYIIVLHYSVDVDNQIQHNIQQIFIDYSVTIKKKSGNLLEPFYSDQIQDFDAQMEVFNRNELIVLFGNKLLLLKNDILVEMIKPFNVTSFIIKQNTIRANIRFNDANTKTCDLERETYYGEMKLNAIRYLRNTVLAKQNHMFGIFFASQQNLQQQTLILFSLIPPEYNVPTSAQILNNTLQKIFDKELIPHKDQLKKYSVETEFVSFGYKKLTEKQNIIKATPAQLQSMGIVTVVYFDRYQGYLRLQDCFIDQIDPNYELSVLYCEKERFIQKQIFTTVNTNVGIKFDKRRCVRGLAQVGLSIFILYTKEVDGVHKSFNIDYYELEMQLQNISGRILLQPMFVFMKEISLDNYLTSLVSAQRDQIKIISMGVDGENLVIQFMFGGQIFVCRQNFCTDVFNYSIE